MADSFNKKEREKKRRKRKQDKREKKQQLKEEGGLKEPEFMYLNEDGSLTTEPPDPTKKTKINAEDIDLAPPKRDDGAVDFSKKGIVKFYNSDKGFGFIKDSNSAEEYFVHIDNVDGDIKEGDKVIFEIGKGPKGLMAINVKQAPKKEAPKKVVPKTEEPVTEEPRTEEPKTEI